MYSLNHSGFALTPDLMKGILILIARIIMAQRNRSADDQNSPGLIEEKRTLNFRIIYGSNGHTPTIRAPAMTNHSGMDLNIFTLKLLYSGDELLL